MAHTDRRSCDTDVITSPTHITDYFKARKSPVKGYKSKASKASQLDTSSVYLTPENSPSKDQSNTGDDVIDLVSSETPLKRPLQACYISQQNICPQDQLLPDDVHGVNANVLTVSKSSNEMTNGILSESRCNDLVPDFNLKHAEGKIADQEFEKPVLSHFRRSASRSRSKDLKKEIHSIHSSDSPAALSPSLPRPKMRKGTRSKNGKVEADAIIAEPSQSKPTSGRRKKKEPAPVQTSTITDFFPVRRSGRQTKREIENQKQQLVEKLITSNCEDGLEIKNFEEKGRGIMATKPFDKGDFVIEYAGDLIDPSAAREREEKYSETPEVGCYMYYFVHGDKHYCIDATPESGRLGRLLNHSRDGNCCTRVVSLKDGPRLILVAARDIKAGEELSYDYGDRRKSSIESYPWLKL